MLESESHFLSLAFNYLIFVFYCLEIIHYDSAAWNSIAVSIVFLTLLIAYIMQH